MSTSAVEFEMEIGRDKNLETFETSSIWNGGVEGGEGSFVECRRGRGAQHNSRCMIGICKILPGCNLNGGKLSCNGVPSAQDTRGLIKPLSLPTLVGSGMLCSNSQSKEKRMVGILHIWKETLARP